MTVKSKHHPDYPNVSVIILTFNGSQYIKPLLESLENQSYPRDLIEILVVDNASTDDTVRLAREGFPSVKIINLEKNIGFAAGNNEALLHVSHDLLVFLNQDTICHPGFLKAMVELMQTDKSLAACNPNIITPDKNDLADIYQLPSPQTLFLCDLSPFGYGQNRIINGKTIYRTKFLSGCAFIIRRETISKLEYLFDDQLFMYAEDTDLSLRIHNTDQKICVTRNAIVYHLHNSNMALGKGRLITAAGAIRNRVIVFYKNMRGLEFLLFFPFLFFGGIFKIFEFQLNTARKAIYFLPFGFFSMACMLSAIFYLPRFAAKNRRIMKKRRMPKFALLKLILNR
jgi:GT2 family glycosyltransferase